MKRFILFAILVLIALSPLAYTQEIGGVYGVFSPAKIGGKKLPSWLSSEYSPIFNGVNQWAVHSTGATPAIGTGPLTVMLWIYRIAPKQFSNYLRSAANNGPGAVIDIIDNGATGITVGDNRTYSYFNIGGLQQWNHVTVVKKANESIGSASVYINSYLTSPASVAGATSTPSIITSLAPFLGANGPDYYMNNCKISELAFFNKELSPSEVSRYWNKRLKGTENGLISLYHLNDNANTFVDSVAGKTIVATNSVQWTKRNGFQPPDVRSERWALSFDGVDDKASGTNTQISTYPFTIESWVFNPNPTLTTNCNSICLSSQAATSSFYVHTIGGPTGLQIAIIKFTGGVGGYQIYPVLLSTPRWAHMAVVAESHDLSKLFCNSVQIGTYTVSTPFPAGGLSTIEIGVTRYAGGGPAVVAGKHAETRFWNTARTQSEIQANMYQQMTGSETGLVYYYRGNEGTGSTLANLGSAGSAGNLTLYNSPTWVGRDIPLNKIEKYGISDIRSENYALSFDGVDDIASAPATGFPSGNSARTMMAWIFDSAPTSANYRMPFSYGVGGSGQSIFLGFGSTVANEIVIGIGGWISAFPYVRSSKWSHYAFTLPSGGTLGSFTLYIDGVKQTQTRTYISGNANSNIGTGIGHVNIGGYVTTNVYQFNGKAAEVSVWNRELSESEIQQSMYSKLTGNETGLVRYYKLNEGFGTTLDDVASGGYDMTLLNNPTRVERDIP